MKTLILDGSHSGDLMAPRLRAALLAHLPGAEVITLREQKIGNCAGDFFCWVRSPGVCNVADDNRAIAAKVVQSDLLVYLTPVTFGGYASPLKRMVDHLIQNISPFFNSVNGEIHHQRRYQRYPNLLVIGWMAAPDARSEDVFRHLVQRNTINMYAKTTVCGVITGSPDEADLTAQASAWLADAAAGRSTPVPALPAFAADDSRPAPRKAVLLVGSPRTKNSTSAALGSYLMEQLAARGLETETLMLYPAFASSEKTGAALEKLAAADLVTLAFPLYVDSLPAPVIAALEDIAAHRRSQPAAQAASFMAIANCGFPEALHNENALAVCAQFARQAGFAWSGSLSLGGGQGLVNGTPLAELGGRAYALRTALDQSAEALAQGRCIPSTAQALLAKPVIPRWIYSLFGGFGWQQGAKQFGMQKRLKDRPYEK